MSLINDNNLPTVPSNILTKFRESFETFTNGVNWNLTTGTNDLVQLDGNTGGASYLVISKDPFTQNTETSLTTIDNFDTPIELSAGLHLSQRVVGQEFSMELVSDETPLSAVPDLTISSISQTTTTLTVTTTAAHNLMPGMRVGIRGVTGDSRLNYSSCVVNTIPSSTTFTVTTQVTATLPSVTSGPFTTGTVYYRPAIGYARNGFSQVWENSSATNSSIYVRGSGGDVLPSGGISTTHAVTVGSSVSVQPVAVAGAYSFQPTTEYRIQFQADRISALDSGVDTSSITATRILRTQIVPDATKQYKLRFRATNAKALSVPTIDIISAAKTSGSATATVTTNGAHGLTTGDWIVIHGVRDQTNFFVATTPFQVLSTPTTNTFTAAWGGAAFTGTTYGGFVSRINGSVVPGAYQSASIQTVSITNSLLSMIGNSNWGFTVGDYVNLYGVRVDGTGVSAGVDGVYRVRDVSTVNAALEPIGGTSIPTTLSSTNVGGAVIKRTDFRISFARIFDYTRQRVELLHRSDAAGSVPVNLTGGVVGTVSTVSVSYLNYNQLITDITSAALTATSTSGTVTPGSGTLSHEFNVIVTAVSGTNPTMDVVVQESDDSGTNWYDVYHFPRITATGQYRSPLIPLTGNRIRYVRTLTGTSPSFTNSVNRLQSHTSNPLQRSFFNRTLDPNTLNSTTPSFLFEGCKDHNIIISMGAITTTAPVLAIEGTFDGTNWYSISTDVTPTANNINFIQISNVQARYIRVRTKTAGSGATLSYIGFRSIGA